MRTYPILAILIPALQLVPNLTWAADKLEVVSSINPLSAIVRRVGQDQISIHTLISGQGDPHGFELKPSELKLLYRSALIVHNGFGLEHWARGFDKSLMDKILDLSEVVPEAAWNMHTWLDPLIVVKQVEPIRNKLCKLLQDQCPLFSANAESYKQELFSLHNEITATISSWNQKKYVAYHRSWDHFAKRYGLEAVGEFQVSHSTETTIPKLKALVDSARQQSVKVFWLDAQASSQRVSAVVRDAQLSVVIVDEIGASGEDYISLMRRNVLAMSEAMKN